MGVRGSAEGGLEPVRGGIGAGPSPAGQNRSAVVEVGRPRVVSRDRTGGSARRRAHHWRRGLAGMALAVAMVASGSVTVSVGAAQQATGAEDHVLRLKSRRIDPGPGVDIRSIERAAGPNGRVHFFLQVHILPDATEKRRYAAEGIDLLNYVTGNTYIASAPVASVRNLRNLPGVRWAAPIDADDKITADTKASQVGDWARDRRGQVVLDITVHPDVALGEAEALVARYGGALLASIPAIPAVTAAFNPGQAGRIVGEDIVQYVDAVSPPLGDHNNGAVPAINAVPLATTPYNLDGTGVTVLVFDSGRIDNGHPDFGTRILTADGSGIRLHSTHVGGTVGGSGANSNGNDSAGAPNGGTANQWAGVAPGVNLRSFGSDGDGDMYNDAGQINGDFATAINQGIDIATMSQGNNVVGNGLPCGQLGDYTGTALLMDNIVRGSLSGQQLIFTQSAGNERGTPPGRTTCGMGFSTISSPGTAKNPIVVGAINSNDNSMTNFSSHGPTDDGRLKPDIVGPGCQSNGDGGITSTGFDDLDPPGDGRPNGDLDAGEVRNAYVSMCGTSMSTPAVAGALALVTEQWRSTRPARPLGHTAKAISIHTATDLGNIGPDYQFGWGAFNARAAVDLVRADDTADLIQVEQVDNGQTDTYTFNSDGSAPVRVTLVWSDPAATQLAATALVNNVDLRLVDPDGVESQPLVLDAAQPGNAASAGNDTANNVEMVVAGAKAGTWEVRVVGTAVPTGPQQYTLVTPTDSALNRRPVANAGGPYNSAEGTDVVLNGGASTDADGNTLTHEWDFDNDGQFDDATGPGPSFGLVGQDGVLPVRLRVTDTEGAFSVGQSQVTVTNVAPGFAVLASNAPRDENTEVTLIGTATDPGWLDGLTVTREDDGTTLIHGPVADQAALFGVIHRLRDMALPLISITHAEPPSKDAPTAHPHRHTPPARPPRRPGPGSQP